MRASNLWRRISSRRGRRDLRWIHNIRDERLSEAVAFAVEPMEKRLLLAGNVVISEFMADNSSGIKDYYGQNSDWIELHNLATTAQDISGWHLTDNAADLTEWTFPAGSTIPAGGYLVVFASSRDTKTPTGELHTNFKLSSTGEYLGLTDTNGAVVFDYGPTYPQQYADVSYGIGSQTTTTKILSPGAADKWSVPTSAGALDPNWASTSFGAAGWTSGTTGLGYDTTSSTDNLSIIESHSATALSSILDGINLIMGGGGTITTYTASNINYNDPGNAATGHYASSLAFGGNTAGDDNNFALRIHGAIKITTAGTYTFGVRSDDGFSLNIGGATFTALTNCTNATGSNTMEFANTRSSADSFGQTTLAAGTYDFELYYFASTGASGLEFFSSSGAKTAFDSGFQLVGDTANGGLPLAKVADYLGTNTGFQSASLGVNASAFVRIPFNVSNPANIAGLTLRMRYDDGFVAYLNGQEVARDNAPNTPVWNSAATTDQPTGDSVRQQDFSLSDQLGFLLPGANVLAIQALNSSAADTNFLIQPQLEAVTQTSGGLALRYFVTSTPRAANGTGATDLGPIVTDVSTPVTQPGDNDNIVVTAKVRQATSPVSGSPTLYYRVMYNAEQSVPMYDDGPAGGHGDAVAGDGTWTGTIPASASTPGQMVRWYVQASDTAGNTGRWPVLVPLVGNDAGPEYVGTVIGDPTLTSTLPIFHYFTNNVAGSNGSGARGSVFYLGEFYDNVFFRHRGSGSVSGVKIEFNSGYDFRWEDDKERVKEIDINNRGALDDAYIRPVIGFETFKDAGVPALTVFPMRIQLNGTFSRVALFLEQTDNRMLEQNGLYPNGALYKMASDNPLMNNANSMEKKNRDEETTRSDLTAFFNGIHLTGAAQIKFIYDNVDIPSMLDYMAANILTGDEDDAQKNYFLYRDTNDGTNAFYDFANPKGTNEWRMLPWDKDLTYGKNYGLTDYQAHDPQTHPFFPSQGYPKVDGPGAYLWLTDALLKIPEIKQMYLRRLRSIMDAELQAPGTPLQNRYYETRLDELFAELSGDPTALASMGNLSQAFTNLKTLYLDARRVHLYIDHSLNTSYPDYAGIPAQQNGDPQINFGTYVSSPASGNQDEEYLTLTNPNSFAVDLSDWRLTGGVEMTFKKGVVIPAGGTLYVSPNIFAFRNRAGRPTTPEFVTGNYSGYLSRLGEIVTLQGPDGKTVATLTTSSAPSAQQESLRITEIMYHPQDPAAGSPYKNDDFEFIEVKNIGATTLSLSGVRFTDGVYFDFTGSTMQSLAPGAFALVVGNKAAFQSRYGNAFDSLIAGTFAAAPGSTITTNLDNGGERLRLADPQGETIEAFSYNDSGYTQTDGLGSSLVIRNASAPVSSLDSSSAWSASNALGGSPGADDTVQVGADAVVINEILANTTTDPHGQWIELLNTTGAPINIGGWFLSDDASDLKEYQIAAGTTLPANGYLTFTQNSNFGNAADPGRLKAFTLNSAGATLYLTSASGGAIGGYQTSEKYSASAREVSMGRHITSTVEKDFVAMSSATFGTANASPLVGPVVINEVMYHPPVGGDQFIELKNLTSADVKLYDPANPQNTWKLSEGISFTFPSGASIPANGYALVVKTSPAFFRSKYNIPASVPIFGPFLQTLNNDNDTVELKRPGDPPSAGANAPYIRVDQVHYTDRTPWPVNADGFGASLNRITGNGYGDDVANWQQGHSTPGAAFTAYDTTAPSVPGLPTTQIISSTRTDLSWVGSSDPQSGVAYYNVYANGNRIAATTGTTFSDTWTAGAPRTYQISAVNKDGVESALSGAQLAANIVSVTPDPRSSSVSQITIVFSGAVTGFDLADLVLSRSGGANLLTASQTLTTSDHITWTLGNLGGITGAAGNYLLTLKASGSGIIDGTSQPLAADALTSWKVDLTAPTVSVTPVAPDPRLTTVDQITIVFSEPVTNFSLSSLTLKRNGGSNLLTASQTLQSSDGITWTLGNLGQLTNIMGTYVLNVVASAGVTDLAGNSLATGATDSWVMSITSQTPFDTTDDHLGTVTAQGENGTNEGMLKAFDNDSATKWLDFANANPSTRASWIQYQYVGSTKYIVTQYTITSANDAPARDPRDWQLLGSNDGGATWVVLDTRSGETFANRFQKNTYSVSNSVAYNVYRLNILSVANPGGANSVQLSEIELIGLPPPPPPTVTSATFDPDVTRKLSFKFSQSVQQSLTAADLTVHNNTTNQDLTVQAPTYDAATDTATFGFATLPDGNYTATLSAAGINDIAGSQLDGNGDGNGGDNYTFSFFVLAGDADHDRTIGFNDLVAVAQNYGMTSGATAAKGDANGDGKVDFSDLVIIAQKYGKTLPAGSDLPAPSALPVTSPTGAVSADPQVAPVTTPVAPVSKPAATTSNPTTTSSPALPPKPVKPAPVANPSPAAPPKPVFSVTPLRPAPKKTPDKEKNSLFL